MIKAIIFDLDDTLYNEYDYVISGFKAVDYYLKQEYQIQDFFKIADNLYNSGKKNLIFNNALEILHINYDDAFIKNLISIYRSHKPNIKLSHEVYELLLFLKERYKLGLITDGYAEVQRNKISTLKLDHFFQSLIITDELGQEFWKPHKKAYLLTQKKLQVIGKQCVYIGDNVKKDFFSANNLGWSTIHYKNPHGIYFNVKVHKEYEAKFSINSLQDLQNLF